MRSLVPVSKVLLLLLLETIIILCLVPQALTTGKVWLGFLPAYPSHFLWDCSQRLHPGFNIFFKGREDNRDVMILPSFYKMLCFCINIYWSFFKYLCMYLWIDNGTLHICTENFPLTSLILWWDWGLTWTLPYRSKLLNLYVLLDQPFFCIWANVRQLLNSLFILQYSPL